MVLNKLIITKENINKFIKKEYIRYYDNNKLLQIFINVKILIIKYDIERLECNYNIIEELYIDDNISNKIITIDCRYNNLKTLNITKFKKVRYL